MASFGVRSVSGARLVLLDLDGTIIDSAPGIVAGMKCAFAAVGADVPAESVLRSWIGPPVLRTLDRELGAQGEDVVFGANEAFREYFDTVGAHETAVFPGMPDALEHLDDGGFVIVVVTHKPQPLAELALEAHGLDPLVRAIHAPTSPEEWVPKEDLFAAALEDFPVNAVIAAGDRGSDIDAAAVHSVPSIGVTWGYGTPEELTEAGAVALASVADELPALLAKHIAPRT
jgi:phosphoglycolate phosphatase